MVQKVNLEMTDGVQEELDKRTIYVGSVAELEALPSPVSGQEAIVGGCPFKYNGTSWKPTAHVTPEIYGATFDGTDDTAAWNAMATSIAPGQIVTSSTPGGTSTCNFAVTFTKDVIFDMPGITVDMNGGDFDFSGSITTLTATLSVDAKKADREITVSDGSQFSEGDVIVIQNADNFSFSLHRDVYQDGEFLTVLSVSGNTVTFSSGILSSYLSSGNIQFHKITPIKVSLKGLSFTGIGSDNLLGIDLAKDFYIESVNVKGGTNRALGLRRCYGGEIVGGEYEHKEPAGGTNYGISVANCQDLNLRPSRAFGTRHGVVTGGFAGAGAVPCRNVFIENASIASSDSHGADIHGNAENCWYINCDIYGGTGIGGKDCGVVGGTVFQRPGVVQPVLQLTEVVGGTIKHSGIRTAFAENSSGTIGAAGSSIVIRDVSEDLKIVFTDLQIDKPSSNTSVGVFSFVITQNGELSTEMEIDNISLNGDVSPLSRIFSGGINNDAVWSIAPQPFKRFKMDNIKIDTSSLSNWMVPSGSIAAGSIVTLPKLTFSSVQTVLSGAYESSGFALSFPSYGNFPEISVSHSGATLSGSSYLVPVVTASSANSASVVLTTMHSTETLTADRTARVRVKVGFDEFEWQ